MSLADRLTDRRFLVTAVALLVVATGAWGLTRTPDGEPERDPLDGVPADADYVGHLDAETYREDPDVAFASRRAFRFQSAVQFYDGPPFLGSYAVGDSPLNASRVHEVTYFGRHDGSYGARILVTGWTSDELAGAVETTENVSLERTTVNGSTVHRGDGLAVASLGNTSGRRVLAVGNATAVLDALAVTQGGQAALDGELRRQFEAGPDGYARFAFRFRPGTVPNYPFVGEAVESVRYVRTAYALNRSTGTGSGGGGATGTPTTAANATPDVEVTLDVTTEDSDTARSVRGILNAGVTFYRIESGNATLRAELSKVGLEPVEGRTVRLTYRSSPTGVRVLVRGLYRNQPEPTGVLERPSRRART